MTKEEKYKRSFKKHLYFGGSLSINELSALANKSLPLTIKILNQLLHENEVIETGLANSTGGRRPQTYSLRHDLMYVVAVAVDQLVTRIALIDMHGKHQNKMGSIELVLKNNSTALEALATFIEEYIEKSGVERKYIAGIGIGMPGFVDFNKGINHSFFKTSHGSIVKYIESTTGLPVLIDNDSSLIALAELRHGAGKGKENVMVLNIGWGVGLGVILNGSLFRGNDGFAGEFSHIPIFTNNKICSCGKMGCLETETSLIYIIQKALEGIEAGEPTILKNLSIDHAEKASREIMKAALEGDKFSISLISQAGYNIGRGIAILAHLLNPGLIVLSGRGSIGGKLWLAPIQQAINEHCIPKIAENLEIEISSLGYTAEILGAADLVMEHYDELKIKQSYLNETQGIAV
jgi:predicted NBD/HSP70 family sugar kinase